MKSWTCWWYSESEVEFACHSAWPGLVRILISISGLLLRFLLSSINQNAEKLVRIYVVSNFLLKFKLAPIDPAYRKTKGPLYRTFASINSLQWRQYFQYFPFTSSSPTGLSISTSRTSPWSSATPAPAWAGRWERGPLWCAGLIATGSGAGRSPPSPQHDYTALCL